MHVLSHWLATDRRYSTDPADAKVLATKDEAEQYRADGWRVDGPYVEQQAGAVSADAQWIADQRARLARTREHNAPGFEEQYKQGYERCLDELEESRGKLARKGNVA